MNSLTVSWSQLANGRAELAVTAPDRSTAGLEGRYYRLEDLSQKLFGTIF